MKSCLIYTSVISHNGKEKDSVGATCPARLTEPLFVASVDYLEMLELFSTILRLRGPETVIHLGLVKKCSISPFSLRPLKTS